MNFFIFTHRPSGLSLSTMVVTMFSGLHQEKLFLGEIGRILL